MYVYYIDITHVNLQVQTWLRLVDFFQNIKILSTSPESEISGSLKNLKPEKNRPLSKI
jgi:hypothetical protein